MIIIPTLVGYWAYHVISNIFQSMHTNQTDASDLTIVKSLPTLASNIKALLYNTIVMFGYEADKPIFTKSISCLD